MSFNKNKLSELLDLDLDSYLLELNEKITLLMNENERLKKIIVQKNKLIQQLEECILLSTNETPNETPNETLNETPSHENTNVGNYINYVHFENYLYKNGLYRHPKMVMKYIHH